jgi:uncharacterized protein (TIGR01777 family)
MKLFFTGGTGFIGNLLITQLVREGHEITILVGHRRKVKNTHEKVTVLEGDSTASGNWQERVREHDVIFNLAGVSIFQRWSSKVKKEIYDSRILSTRNIIEALKNSFKKGIRLFSSSGAGYYGYHQDEILNESSPPGDSFLARVAVDWESEALKAQELGTRVVLCRFGIVLGRGGGALKRTIPLFKCYLGGRWGKGNQWFSWMHEMDLVGSFLFLLAHEEIEGPVNFTAPNPVHNSEMANTLSEVMRKRRILPTIPGFLMRGILGEFSEVFLKGQRVFPHRLLENGYNFQFPKLKECLTNLLSQCICLFHFPFLFLSLY